MIKNYLTSLKQEFSGYNTAKLMKDIMAGLTVCAVALPLALAFGVSSGATAAAGLVTAIIAGVVIAVLGGASFQISGPTGAMSAVLVGIVASYGLQGVFFACFAAGALLLLAGIFKLGRLISFIPMPVIMGFTSGIAIIIAMGQIDNFFGTASEGSSNLAKIASYARLGFHPNLQAVLIGLLVVVVMIVWPKKWGARVPGSLVGIILATVVSALFRMFLLGGVMARLPLAALAGVLMVTAWRMNDWGGIRYLFSHKLKSGISQFLVTMLATVIFDLTVAILLGVAYSAILYIAKSSQIGVSFSDIDANKLRTVEGKPPVLETTGVVYVTGSLFFGAVDEFNRRMAEMPAYDHVIFSLRGMPNIDVSGAQAVLELCESLQKQGKTVACCGMADGVRTYFDRTGITVLLGETAYFWNAEDAILDLLSAEIAE